MIFVLKYVLEHSESIPTKKFFRPKIFVLAIFSTCDPIFRKNGYVKLFWVCTKLEQGVTKRHSWDWLKIFLGSNLKINLNIFCLGLNNENEPQRFT